MTALAAGALIGGAALGQPKTDEPPTGGRERPPAEAMAACKTLKAQDACSFNGGRGAVSGTCWAPEGAPLACRPKDAPAASGSVPARNIGSLL